MTTFEFEAVFLARYGQTQWNTAGRKQGQLDSALLHDPASTFRGPALWFGQDVQTQF
ncbi:hypothetical protein [Glycomyces rhizosphaerae]|uniref:Uncharacterized protein n=1 Tax=Glycomyces rhizosphaerae TaxID=2054422 RepID=A0ABV7Q967_9ACTN